MCAKMAQNRPLTRNISGLPRVCQGFAKGWDPHGRPVFIGLPRVPRVPRVLAGGWGWGSQSPTRCSAFDVQRSMFSSFPVLTPHQNSRFCLVSEVVRDLSDICQRSGPRRKARLYWFVRDVRDVRDCSGWVGVGGASGKNFAYFAVSAFGFQFGFLGQPRCVPKWRTPPCRAGLARRSPPKAAAARRPNSALEVRFVNFCKKVRLPSAFAVCLMAVPCNNNKL
jgi:hypothetical protein